MTDPRSLPELFAEARIAADHLTGEDHDGGDIDCTAYDDLLAALDAIAERQMCSSTRITKCTACDELRAACRLGKP